MSFERKNVYASIPATTRGKPYFLGGDPKGDNFLYTCGMSVVIRNIHNPLIADLYDEHQRNPTVAAYAPSGYYIASGDSTGTVRIWDTTQAEHPLKAEFHVLGAPIYDIAWSEDSKRVIVGGDGREKYGHAFFWDSGASVGEIAGHSKPINSVSCKPTRPYRVVTGSEDFVVNWYEGPPFKYKGAKKDHTRFVNCVRFSPNGNLFASVSSDKTGFLYDGKTGEKKLEFSSDGGHTGGIYCCSWNADSSKLLTASADRSCKIWDAETGKCVTTFQFEKTTDNQQLGCLWQGNYLLSVNLAGEITYLDESNPSTPQKVLKGHNKAVTALTYDSSKSQFYSGSYDAHIIRWDTNTGETSDPSGKGHDNQVNQISLDGGNIVTAGMDDSVRVTSLEPFAYGGDKIGQDSPVAGVVSHGGVSVSASMKTLTVIKDGSVASTVDAAYTPASIAISPKGDEVAVGGQDKKIHIYSLSGTTLTETNVLEQHRDFVTALAYSPDGAYLGSGGKDRYVMVWDNATRETKISGWCFHTGTVTGVAWAPDSLHLASSGIDQDVFVWSVEKKMKRIKIKGAHRGGANAVTWLDNNTVASAGVDCCIKTWTITHH